MIRISINDLLLRPPARSCTGPILIYGPTGGTAGRLHWWLEIAIGVLKATQSLVFLRIPVAVSSRIR